MNIEKLKMILLAGVLLLSVNSCKKEDETSTSPSLDGHIDFSVPTYVAPFSKVSMTPRGAIHPDGKEVGYYWKVTPTMTKNDTTRYETGLDFNGNPSDGTFTFTFPDSLKTFTIYSYAFAKGYSNISDTDYCTVVSGGLERSITNLHIAQKATSYEQIGGETIYYTTIGGNDWMMSNLASSSAGAPYFNCKAMSDVFGRYYSYEEALTACPEGWTLPTDADWVALAEAAGAKDAQAHENIGSVAAALMGNAYFNDVRMWEYWPAVGDITNETGMSIIASGFAMLGSKNADPKEDTFIEYSYPNAIFKGYLEYAAFWTADKVADEEGMAYYRYLIFDQPDLMIAKGDINTFGASVRCIRKK
jgi:uncharacterized protein (TIGR02145 family)